jgi:cysteinyl-tRNA synthetase
MALRLYNTLTRKNQAFKPVQEGKVSMYTCGPTVYNYAHIGNFRAYVFEDLLRRFLKFKGYEVKQVMNITDVDDKTIRDSQKEKMSLQAFTDKYTAAFFEDLKTLNIEPAEVYPRATEHIPEMIALIEQLLKEEYAYKSDDGSIYFSIKKFKKYGKLNHIDLKNLKSGARVAQDEYDKDNASDFALWKAYDKSDGDVVWDSPFGKGRPGWHIECSAMAMKHLSDAFKQGQFDPEKYSTFDIHTGGVDNAFPHHEDEIAQSECASHKEFSNYWMHCEHLQVDGKKMSKSLGNFYTLRDLVDKGYDPLAIRYALISTHYKQQLNFTFEGLDAAKNTIKKFYELQTRLKALPTTEKKNAAIGKLCAKSLKEFEKEVDDDLNISAGLAVVFEFLRQINAFISDDKVGTADAQTIIQTMEKIDSVLGVLKNEDVLLDAHVDALIQARNDARKRKDFKESDRIRDELKGKGILLDDTPHGTVWKRA